MDDDMQAMEVRDREIELRLEAFARARLSPDREAVARTRARVMREARLQLEAARSAGNMAPPTALAAHRPIARRLAMPILAASLWLALAVGTISASTAGGPLYHARMWIETATLPVDGVSRANAEITRLNERLAEATAAAARGDAGAVQAAIEAYRQIADEALAGSTGDQALQALVAGALDRHLTVLADVAASLEGKGNDTAAAAVEASIQRAIDHSQAVVDRVGANGAGSGGSGTSGHPATSPGGTDDHGTGSGSGAGAGAGSGSGSDSGSGAGAGSGAGTGTGSDTKPDKTPKPTPEPRPTPEPPDPQGQPDHTPRGPNQ
jgi:hypothetical protein